MKRGYSAPNPGKPPARPRHFHRAQDGLRHHFCRERADGGNIRFARTVESAKITSPSSMVCAGRIVRAMPSCAICATLVACALVKFAFVATTPMTVFARAMQTRADPRPSGLFHHVQRIGEIVFFPNTQRTDFPGPETRR